MISTHSYLRIYLNIGIQQVNNITIYILHINSVRVMCQYVHFNKTVES